MVELNMELPKGYKATGEFRRVVYGDYYYDSIYSCSQQWLEEEGTLGKYIILQKEYSGEDLVGCLCGVSNHDIEEAKTNAEYISDVTLILSYDEEKKTFMGSDSRKYTNAYPVSANEIKRFGNKHIEHLK